MEEDVGGLVVDAVVGLLVGGLDDLLGLLLDLRAGEPPVVEQLDHVGAAGALVPTPLDDALDRGQGLVGRHPVDLAAVEARALAGVAGGAVGLDEGEQRVAVAVQAQRADRLRVAGGRALVPLLGARAAVEGQLARLLGAAQRLGVHVREREDLAGAPVLDDARDQALLVEGDVGGVEHGADPSLGRMLARVAAALAVLALGFAMGAIGLPSSYLFAALVVGVGFALVRPGAVGVPDRGFTAGEAVTGVVLGAYLRSSTLSAVASDWLPVTLVSLGTLAVTTLCGIVLARVAPVDRPTASLGMIAGGASGIVGMADELGADARLVAFMQYLRVLLIVAFTPIAAGVLFGAHGGNVPSESVLGTPGAWLLTIGLGVVGALAGPRLRIPAGTLLAPLLLTGVLTVAGLDLVVPALLREIGFALIGLQVGLRFTTDTLRTARAILPAVLACIAGLVVACFGLAWVLSATADVSLLDAYLATTPGGLYAVLATAFGSGANTTFVLAVQGLRLLVMVLAAPFVVRWLTRSHAAVASVPCSPPSTSSASPSRPSGSSSR